VKIVVVGATGRTGRLVVAQALARGDQVVAFTRQPQEISANPGLKIVVGQLDDVRAFKVAIEGADAVIVSLGTRGKRMTKNVDLMQKCLPSIITAMSESEVLRLVLVSAYGVGETARTAGLIARVVYKMVVPAIYRDKALSERLLPSSRLKWTRVYPVMLTDGPLSDAVDVRPMTEVHKVAGMPKVSRANVARVLLDAAKDDRTIGQTLLVSSKGSVF
jgi:putative NADH-flavin reductase